MKINTTGTNSDGFTGNEKTAFLLLPDGTKASYVLNDTSAELSQFGSDIEVEKGQTKGVIIAYDIDSDGKLDVKTMKDTPVDLTSNTIGTLDKDHASFTAGGTTYGATSSTKFVFLDIDTSSVDVTVATGYKSVDLSTAKARAVCNSDNELLVVYVYGTDTKKSDHDLAVIADEKLVHVDDGDKETWTLSAYVNGEQTDLVFDADPTASGKGLNGVTLKKGDIIDFTYKNNGYVDEGSAVTTTYKRAEVVTDEYVAIGSNQYSLDGVTVYEVEVDGSDLTVSEGVAIEKGDVLFFLGTEPKAIYIVNDYAGANAALKVTMGEVNQGTSGALTKNDCTATIESDPLKGTIVVTVTAKGEDKKIAKSDGTIKVSIDTVNDGAKIKATSAPDTETDPVEVTFSTDSWTAEPTKIVIKTADGEQIDFDNITLRLVNISQI